VYAVGHAMTEDQTELCGKCGAEIYLSRRVDFTLKDGTRRVQKATLYYHGPKDYSLREGSTGS